MVVGSSVGALNGAYYAGDPTLEGVLQLETSGAIASERRFPIHGGPCWGYLGRIS